MRASRAFLLVFLAAGSAAAQEQRASIEGTVTDPSGAVVPLTTVAARSATGWIATVTSDAAGRYRFPSLPVGRYEVRGSAGGFAITRVPDIDLPLGQLLRVDLPLKPARPVETVTVVAERPLLDVAQSGHSTNIRDEQITKLPRDRDFTSLLRQASGVNPEGAADFKGISIDGATGSENRFLIDGAETTHLMTGNSGLDLVTDFVEEVQVKSTGYAAEHGGATGGVVNVITRSGTNRWTGDVGLYYAGDWLKGAVRPFLQAKPGDPSQAEYVIFAKDPFDRWEPGFVVGGPLKKDVAWFFAGYQPARSVTQRTVTFNANHQTGTYASKLTTHNASASVSARIKDKTRMRVAFNMSDSTQDGTLPFQNGNSSPQGNYAIVTRHPDYALSTSIDYVAHRNLFLAARGSYWFANTHQDGVYQGPRYAFLRSNVGMPGVPPELQAPRGFASTFTNSEVTKNVLTRTTAQLDGTLFLSARGRHAIKAGMQLDRPANDVLSGNTGNNVSLFWGDAFQGQRGPFGYYSFWSNGVLPERGLLTEGDVHSDNLAFFVQDAWTVGDRLTLNLGLRAEHERIPSFTTLDGLQPRAIDFGFGQKLAPRVGAAWDVRGDGKWKVYGSWGTFYDAMKYAMARDLFGGVKFTVWWFTLDTPDWPHLMRPGCPPACPGTLIQGPIDFNRPKNEPGDSAIDPELDPSRLEEAVAGVEHALSRVLTVGLRYVHKQIDTAVEDIGARDAEGNQVYMIGNPGFHRAAQTGYGPAFPKAVRDYDGLELTFDKRMAGGWALHASYLLSRLYGNYSGLSYGPEGTPMLNHGAAFDNPIMMFGADGRPVLGVLDSDRTHQFKAHAIYDLSFGTTLGMSVELLSGTPVTRIATFVPGHGYEVQYRGRGSDGRLPMLSQIDLYAQHEVKLGGGRRLQFSVNVLNLLDQAAPLLRYPWELLEPVDIDEATFFRGFDADQLIASQGLRRDPFFLMDYGYQPPREVRLGLKFLF